MCYVGGDDIYFGDEDEPVVVDDAETTDESSDSCGDGEHDAVVDLDAGMEDLSDDDVNDDADEDDDTDIENLAESDDDAGTCLDYEQGGDAYDQYYFSLLAATYRNVFEYPRDDVDSDGKDVDRNTAVEKEENEGKSSSNGYKEEDEDIAAFEKLNLSQYYQEDKAGEILDLRNIIMPLRTYERVLDSDAKHLAPETAKAAPVNGHSADSLDVQNKNEVKELTVGAEMSALETAKSEPKAGQADEQEEQRAAQYNHIVKQYGRHCVRVVDGDHIIKDSNITNRMRKAAMVSWSAPLDEEMSSNTERPYYWRIKQCNEEMADRLAAYFKQKIEAGEISPMLESYNPEHPAWDLREHSTFAERLTCTKGKRRIYTTDPVTGDRHFDGFESIVLCTVREQVIQDAVYEAFRDRGSRRSSLPPSEYDLDPWWKRVPKQSISKGNDSHYTHADEDSSSSPHSELLAAHQNLQQRFQVFVEGRDVSVATKKEKKAYARDYIINVRVDDQLLRRRIAEKGGIENVVFAAVDIEAAVVCADDLPHPVEIGIVSDDFDYHCFPHPGHIDVDPLLSYTAMHISIGWAGSGMGHGIPYRNCSFLRKDYKAIAQELWDNVVVPQRQGNVIFICKGSATDLNALRWLFAAKNAAVQQEFYDQGLGDYNDAPMDIPDIEVFEFEVLQDVLGCADVTFPKLPRHAAYQNMVKKRKQQVQKAKMEAEARLLLREQQRQQQGGTIATEGGATADSVSADSVPAEKATAEPTPAHTTSDRAETAAASAEHTLVACQDTPSADTGAADDVDDEYAEFMTSEYLCWYHKEILPKFKDHFYDNDRNPEKWLTCVHCAYEDASFLHFNIKRLQQIAIQRQHLSAKMPGI